MHPLHEYGSAIRRSWTDARARHPHLAPAVLFVFLLLAIVPLAGVGISGVALGDGLPDTTELRRIGEMDQATAVYDGRDRLAFTIFKEQRIEVPLDGDLAAPGAGDPGDRRSAVLRPPRLRPDRGSCRRRWPTSGSGRAAQGGSTITQQLARQSFLTPDKTFRRKLQELILAARIERLYTKDQILELYLNKVYFGDGLYGVEAASRGYFGKHASELSSPRPRCSRAW